MPGRFLLCFWIQTIKIEKSYFDFGFYFLFIVHLFSRYLYGVVLSFPFFFHFGWKDLMCGSNVLLFWKQIVRLKKKDFGDFPLH